MKHESAELIEILSGHFVRSGNEIVYKGSVRVKFDDREKDQVISGEFSENAFDCMTWKNFWNEGK